MDKRNKLWRREQQNLELLKGLDKELDEFLKELLEK